MYWRFCLASWRQQYGDDRMQTLWLKFFHRWLRHGCAWVVTSLWYHSERVSGTARVAQFILHGNFYDMYSSSEMVYYRCCWPYCNLLGSIRVVDQLGHYHTQDSSERCSECRWETWTKWNLFMRKRSEVFRSTPSKEMTTIWVKQAALRLVDRLARSVPQPARKEGYMPFHPFHRKFQSHMPCSSNG